MTFYARHQSSAGEKGEGMGYPVTAERPYADPAHPGNKLRPRVRCRGCGKLGCITAWGPWCFSCNVARIDRISGFLAEECRRRGIEP